MLYVLFNTTDHVTNNWFHTSYILAADISSNEVLPSPPAQEEGGRIG